MNNESIQLISGTRNVASWTMRTWLVMTHFSIPFNDIKINLNTPDTRNDITKYSPSGKIPCFIIGDSVIWDSLSICEYLAETFPDSSLWPRNKGSRAHARSICAEVHSGFVQIRSALPQNLRLRNKSPSMSDDAALKLKLEILRVQAIILECRTKYGGQCLFGKFSIADAYFIPMLLRFRSYDVQISSALVASYMARILKLAAVEQWVAAAGVEQ